MVRLKKFSLSSLLVLLHLFSVLNLSDTQLLINVKNQGGDVVQETILSNVSEDTVTLEFQRSDGTLITQLLDFKNILEHVLEDALPARHPENLAELAESEYLRIERNCCCS